MPPLLTPELLANVGRTEPPKKELVTRRDIRKYSVATGQRLQKYIDGDEAPPMFFFPLFWDVVGLDQLTPDGVSIDSLIPEFPLKRAMAGGVEIDFHRPALPGEWLVARRTLSDIYEKNGSSGPLIFCEVTMQVETEDGEAVVTEKRTRILR
jgi:hydroxyacyl-ACP dehydratase HTD2-like protein with hotdog domain